MLAAVARLPAAARSLHAWSGHRLLSAFVSPLLAKLCVQTHRPTYTGREPPLLPSHSRIAVAAPSGAWPANMQAAGRGLGQPGAVSGAPQASRPARVPATARAAARRDPQPQAHVAQAVCAGAAALVLHLAPGAAAAAATTLAE